MTSVPSRRAFDHVLIVMFENQYRSYALQNPYLRRLARQGIELGNYFGVMHPSQTNYIASVAGALCNVTSDHAPPPIEERTIVDLVEEGDGLRWKAYMDSYLPEASPWTPDLRPEDAPPYYVKHNPFASFASVVRSDERWRKIGSEATLFSDLRDGAFPEYAWFSPNMWNNGHWLDGTQEEATPRAPALVDQLALWLEGFFERLRFPGPMSLFPPRTLVVVTFDESDFESDYLPELASAYDGPNQVYTVLLGDVARPGLEEEGYNHYSLLRTVEVNFGLGDLGKNDLGSNWFQFLWGRRFRWGEASATPIATRGAACAAGHAGALLVAYAGDDGSVRVRTRRGSEWSEAHELPVDGSGGIAMASTLGELVLVARAAGGALACVTHGELDGWSAARPIPGAAVAEALAMSSFDRDRRVMLAVRGADGRVGTLVWQTGAWGPVIEATAARTDGALALGALGASLYLMVQAPDSRTVGVVSYNTAPFNAVSVPPNPYGGPQDDTTLDAWSPSAFPVAHFSSRPDQDAERREPFAQPYESAGPMAVAVLHGVMHLVHASPTSASLVTETFSLAGLMTPSRPVSYKSADAPSASNGFGTLAEAGWSRQSPIAGAVCGPGGALAMASVGDEVLLLCRSGADAPVELRVGRYEEEAVRG